MSFSCLAITDTPSPHQIPFGKAMYALLGTQFHYAFLTPLSENRKTLGWLSDEESSEWRIDVWKSGEQQILYEQLLHSVDVVIVGSLPVFPKSLFNRIKDGKLTFKYTERIFKRGFILGVAWWFRRLATSYWPLNSPNYHLLAAGAYAPLDFSRVGLFKGRMWTWGYFVSVPPIPPVLRNNEKVRMLWVGRMLNWKRVDLIIEMVRMLAYENFDFELLLVGEGPQRKSLEDLADRYQLKNYISWMPSVPIKKVRSLMKMADIYLFTSNQREGWGVVVNEAMAEGCCVVASRAAGSAPCLIQDGETGVLFQDGNLHELHATVKQLLNNPEYINKIGVQAWGSMKEGWTPEVAAKRFVSLCDSLIDNQPVSEYQYGVCSPADIMSC